MIPSYGQTKFFYMASVRNLKFKSLNFWRIIISDSYSDQFSLRYTNTTNFILAAVRHLRFVMTS